MEERVVWDDIKAPVATGETRIIEPGERITKTLLKELGWSDEKIDTDMAELAKHNSVGSQEDFDQLLQDEEDLEAKRQEVIADATAKALRAFEEARDKERQAKA